MTSKPDVPGKVIASRLAAFAVGVVAGCIFRRIELFAPSLPFDVAAPWCVTRGSVETARRLDRGCVSSADPAFPTDSVQGRLVTFLGGLVMEDVNFRCSSCVVFQVAVRVVLTEKISLGHFR